MLSTKNGALRNSSINWIFLWRLSIQNHLKLSITEKGINKAKYLTWNSIRLKLWRRPVCHTLPKALDISSATARVVLDLLKALPILSDITVRRSAVDKDLQPYWKSEKSPHFSRWSAILSFTSFSKTLLTTERRLTRRYFSLVVPVFKNVGED